MSLEEKLANAKETHWIEELTSEKSEEVASKIDYQPFIVKLGNNIKKYMQLNNVTVADIVEKTSLSEKILTECYLEICLFVQRI